MDQINEDNSQNTEIEVALEDNSEKQEKGCQEKVVELEGKLEETENSRLLALADFYNFRRQVEKREVILKEQVAKGVLMQIVDLIDDFSRMVEDLDKPGEDDIDAFKPVLDKALGILVDNGLQKIEVSVGDKFDPKKMEAIGTLPVEQGEENNTVKHIAQAGYEYQNTGVVFRPARVLVVKST